MTEQFSLTLDSKHGSLLSTLLFNIALVVLDKKLCKKKIKGIHIGEVEVKQYTVANEITLYLENPKKHTQKHALC